MGFPENIEIVWEIQSGGSCPQGKRNKMEDMWLWNSIATRKRSPSDGFLENGLTLLKGHLQSRSYRVKVIDWQKNQFYRKLCPTALLKLNRACTRLIFFLGKRNRTSAKAFFPVFLTVQNAVVFFQHRRMKRHLRQLAEDVVKSGIKVFGVKVWYGEAFTWADQLAREIIKKDPSVLIVAGGFHVTLYEKDFLKHSSFDLGVISEGEIPLEIILSIARKHAEHWDKEAVCRDILLRVQSGELKNLLYRQNGAIHLTPKYTPRVEEKSYPLYDEGTREDKLAIHLVLDSLGCPWGKCNFCVHPHFYARHYPRPVEHIVGEMEHMIQEGIGLFKFAGSETPPDFGKKIAQQLLDRQLQVQYSMGCRPIRGIAGSEARYAEVVEAFAVMLRSGLRAIFMGGESGNDIINEHVMRKGVNRADILTTVRAYREAQQKVGVQAYVSLALIYPSPLTAGISLEQVFRDNITLVEEMQPDSVIVSPCMPFKNSQWYKRAEEFDFHIPHDFVERVMTYEYVLYKPLSLWPSFGNARVGNLDFQGWLSECERLRREIELRDIPTDLTDEYILMAEAAGYRGKESMKRFKRDTLIDLVSSDYRNIDRITAAVNRLSLELSRENKHR